MTSAWWTSHVDHGSDGGDGGDGDSASPKILVQEENDRFELTIEPTHSSHGAIGAKASAARRGRRG